VALQSPTNNTYNGQAKPSTYFGNYNQLYFIINQLLSKMQTATIVKVVSCSNAGGVDEVGFVDVVPLVDQVDGNNNAYPHATVYNLPYLRLQGGANAIIIDPAEGDLGIAVFASRDISNVKTQKTNAAPASFRQFDFADGMYLGGLLNGTPQNYIQFQNNNITIKATSVIIDGNLSVIGSINSTHDITADGISLKTHVHSGVQSGGSNTGQPVS